MIHVENFVLTNKINLNIYFFAYEMTQIIQKFETFQYLITKIK